jgi:transglutaminase-like putative cysteine protease
MKAKVSLHPLHPLTPAQTWWLLATGLAAFAPLTSQVPLWLAVTAGATFIWRAALAWWHQPLPTRWVLIFITLAGSVGVFIEYRTLFGQKAGVALLLAFLALKQLEARAPRDGLAIVLLAYFLTLTQFFENQSIPVAFTMLGTLVITTAALASLTDAQASPLGLVRLAGLMLAQALPFMLILFVLFPRVSGPLWGLPADAYSSLSGLSDNMSPGAINNLIQSDAIAFRVKFDETVPPRKELYWRGPVFSRLEGRTWRPGIRSVITIQPDMFDSGIPAYAYNVTLEPHNKPWLFALEFPRTLPPDAFATGDFQLQSKKLVRERKRYAIISQPELKYQPENPMVLDEALSLSLAQNPRTLALGADWQTEGGSDSQRLQRAIDFMRSQRLLYTLQPPLMGMNVADEFLFDYKRGFCEHFSAAFVVLMRASGVPARVVTGYQGGEHNPVDDTWVIRQSDAHAWAEVWLAGRGWVRIDPTAVSMPARIEQNLAAAVPAGEPLPFLARAGFDWLREARFRWWAVNNAWNQWVLGYDPQRQRDFLEKLGMRSPDWGKMTATLAVLCGSLLLALSTWMLYRRPRLDPVERQWRKLSRRLGKRGLSRQPWEGPRDYAHRIAQAQPANAAEIGRIAALYIGLRYGRLSPRLIDALRRQVAAFKP